MVICLLLACCVVCAVVCGENIVFQKPFKANCQLSSAMFPAPPLTALQLWIGIIVISLLIYFILTVVR